MLCISWDFVWTCKHVNWLNYLETLKKITLLYLSLIFTKEIFNGKVRVRSKVSSSIWDQKWVRQYLLAPEPGPTWVISSWWLSVYDPMTSAFLLSLLNAKRINIDIKIEADWHERNKYGILWNITHSSFIVTTKFIKLYVWH